MTTPSTTVAEPRIRAEIRIPIDASEAPIAFEDTYPEATDLAVEMAGPAGLLATLVLPIGQAREWAAELFAAVSVAYREVTGDPHALTDDELQALPLADAYQPGPGLIVHGNDHEPARARFHVEVEIEAEFLSNGGPRAALVEAISRAVQHHPGRRLGRGRDHRNHPVVPQHRIARHVPNLRYRAGACKLS
jgi:hypothetical protein